MTPTSAQDIRDAAALLASATDVTVLGHVRPDADALGSALALGRALRQRGAKVRVSFGEPDEAPETLRWLDEDGLLTHPDDLPDTEALLVCVDTPVPKRLGRLAGRVELAGSVLVIDHHATNTFYGGCNVVDESAEASAILVFRILDAMDVELDEPIARGIYAGIVTDTSGFRRASPETHRMAARLLEAGVDAELVVRKIVDERPFTWLPMLSAVLREAELEPEVARGRGFVHAVVRVDAARTVRGEEVESVIDVIRSVREAAVAAVLKQDLANPAQWQISLRSIGIDVSVVAAEFGGGGHRQAAGCTIAGTAEEVLAGLRAALERAPLL
ncbi:bifunctional oligoribonuclease/PAP phosphatase NrnA [Amycolatopsis sp. NPDC051061]|uniref:DHH family phosphoesterase n=1 Tax=Amycolatopsis sp. NPDC051061 TaxID=3155042 RepID=UPI00343FB1DB